MSYIKKLTPFYNETLEDLCNKFYPILFDFFKKRCLQVGMPEFMHGRMMECHLHKYNHDKEIILSELKRNPFSYNNLDQEFRYNPEIVIAAIEEGHIEALKYTAPEYKDSWQILFAAIRQEPKFTRNESLQYASDRLKNKKELVLASFETKQGGYNLLFASNELKQSKEVVLAAVSSFGLALKFAHHFQDDLDVVKAAVAEDKDAIRFASPRLQENPDILGIRES